MQRYGLALLMILLLGNQVACAVTGPTVTGQQLLPAIYKVRKGDTLSHIARRTKIPVAELMRLNGLSSPNIKPGQALHLNADPVAPEVTPQINTTVTEAIEKEAPELSSLLKEPLLSLLAAPYRFGGNSRKGIDCSGFVQQVFKEFKFELPRTAREQYRLGEAVTSDGLQTGDLLFFHTYAKFPSHVGIYLGNDKMLHASARSKRIVVSDISSNYYQKHYIGARRLGLNPAGEPLVNILSAGVAEELEDGAMESSETPPAVALDHKN